MKNNVLILGSGGREHAFALKISQSPSLNHLFVAPGNPGTDLLGTNLDCALTDFEGIAQIIKKNKINLLIIGPEKPLADGLVDYLNEQTALSELIIVGPNGRAAKLESSKAFAKEFMLKHSIPTAKYVKVTPGSIKEGYAFLDSLSAPYVLKADGLAAGKGVFILHDILEAKDKLKALLYDNALGASGKTVVIEEFLEGIEVSFFILTHKNQYYLLPEAKDYKRIGEGDTGANTGGMGAISPVGFVDDAFKEKVQQQIIIPTLKGLKADDVDYSGFLFFGLINVKGNPYVIEYNVRMGDPETQVVLPRIEDDFLEKIRSLYIEQKSDAFTVSSDYSGCVVLVSGGYPGHYEKNLEITGLDKLQESKAVFAGIWQKDERYYTSSGRVLALQAKQATCKGVFDKIYKDCEQIRFDYKFYRKDIGYEFQ